MARSVHNDGHPACSRQGIPRLSAGACFRFPTSGEDMKNVSLMLVSSALLAFGAGAVQAGQAAPQQSQPSQQPPAQQQQLPAPQPASADQVAKCDKVANSIMTSLKNKDFNGATSNFNDELKPMLPADKLEEGWNSLVSKFGQPQNIGHASGGQQI